MIMFLTLRKTKHDYEHTKTKQDSYMGGQNIDDDGSDCGFVYLLLLYDSVIVWTERVKLT